MKYIFFVTVILFAVSCQNISSKTETVSAEQVFDNSSVDNDDDEISAIHKIDFQNFTYPLTKTFGGKEKSFTLKNGISALSYDKRVSLQSLLFTSDEDKALIVIKIDNGNATYEMLYVYEIKNKKPKLMESFDFGENNIFFGTAFEAHGELIIETYHQLPGDAECCPSIIEISNYRWQKDKFILQGEPQRVANGYVERLKRKNEKN